MKGSTWSSRRSVYAHQHAFVVAPKRGLSEAPHRARAPPCSLTIHGVVTPIGSRLGERSMRICHLGGTPFFYSPELPLLMSSRLSPRRPPGYHKWKEFGPVMRPTTKAQRYYYMRLHSMHRRTGGARKQDRFRSVLVWCGASGGLRRNARRRPSRTASAAWVPCPPAVTSAAAAGSFSLKVCTIGGE